MPYTKKSYDGPLNLRQNYNHIITKIYENPKTLIDKQFDSFSQLFLYKRFSIPTPERSVALNLTLIPPTIFKIDKFTNFAAASLCM